MFDSLFWLLILEIGTVISYDMLFLLKLRVFGTCNYPEAHTDIGNSAELFWKQGV